MRVAGADEPLPVGSSFKLAVLRAVERAVSEGRTSWDEAVELTEQDISLPSGILQDWPTGAAVTVESAALLMMSRSDNTATDLLIRHLGRTAVEEFSPNSIPLLTTREAFLLKSEDGQSARRSYIEGSVRERREILRDLSGELPPESLFAGGPVHLEIEWFFTAEELTGLILEIDRMDILGVNAGPLNRSDWQDLGYKGGSEPGVLNMTVRVVSASGDEYAVSATQTDDAPVDTNAFTSALQSILVHLR
jgi:beta-lactamase class A